MDEEWVSITEAAARLTDAGDAIDRSTLSRYLKQHSEALPVKRDGKSNLVDLTALGAHRGENIRLRPLAPQGRPAASRGSQTSSFPRSQSDGAARKATADAELREMDLAERRRELTPIHEVDQSCRDAVALMMSAFERAIDGDAATLSLRYGWDERVVRIALKQFSKSGLEVFHREMLHRLDALRREGEAGTDPGEFKADGLVLQ